MSTLIHPHDRSIGMSNVNFSAAARKIFAVGILAVTACVPQPITPGGLVAPGMRVSNEIIEADLAMISIWRERLDVVRDRVSAQPASRDLRSRREYAIAKAEAWLSFARDEYATEPRGEVADAALARARMTIELLEQDSVDAPSSDPESNVVAGTATVHPELWRGVAQVRADSNSWVVASDLAELEVALVRAGRVQEATGAACRAQTHLIRARRILARANSRVAEFAVPMVVARADSAPADTAAANQPVTVSVHFALDRSELSAASRKILDNVVEALRAHPEFGVVLEGHADPRGRAAYNMALSRRRVEQVRDYLASKGLVVDRMETRAMGTSARAASGTSALDYALDRRVTMQFLAPGGSILTEGDKPTDLQLESESPKSTKRSGR
jgi:outer membrane protein OmpA-like peptidoglycan-associated protein